MTEQRALCGAIITLLFIILGAVTAWGQERANHWEDYLAMLVDEMQDDELGEVEDLEELTAVLGELAMNPLNINAATREDLAEWMIFSDMQIDEIINYISRYGPYQTKVEYTMLSTLDPARRGLLRLLTTCGEMAPRKYDWLDSLDMQQHRAESHRRYAKASERGEVTSYLRVPFYERVGDSEAYAGAPLKHWLRASYTYDHLKVGVLASQDPGEPFFSGKNKCGYDYYAAYLQLRRLGILKNMVLGQYKLRSGLGLVLNSSQSFGKTFTASASGVSTSVILPHLSRTESSYLQGAAVTLAPTRQMDVTLFASYRYIDATLTDSSTAIRTILPTGYHRTESELERKHNATQSSGGVVARYNFERFNFGLTALYNHYSLPLKPYTEGSSDSQLYRMFYPAGQDFWNVSLNYGYHLGTYLRFEGETATGDSHKVATVNSFSWRVVPRVLLQTIYRYYPISFTATMGRAFSEGGRNQNESGLYTAVQWKPVTDMVVSGYVDVAYFPWPKYLALGSSHSFDNQIQMTYNYSSRQSFLVRYRYKAREKNSDTEGVLIYKQQHGLRVAHDYELAWVTLRTQVDASYCAYKTRSAGAMLSETARYTTDHWSVALAAALFDTQDYDSRVYLYERSTPFSFASQSFYGQGTRLYAYAQRNFRHWAFIAKLGMTHYFDRETIGSSYQMINGSTQTDLELMVRYKLK